MTDEGKVWRYNWLKRLFLILGTIVSLIYFLVLLNFDFAFMLRDFVESATLLTVFQIALYALIFLLGLNLINLPLSFISGYLLEHRFKMSTQRFTSWAGDEIKEWGVSLTIAVPAIVILYRLLEYTSWWWLWAGVFSALLFIFLTFITPTVLLPLFIPCRPLENEELSLRLADLAEKAGVNVKRVLRMELSRKTKAANAALSGIGRSRSILLADTLLDNFTPDEIEAVMGHELAHHRFRHIWKGIGLSGGLMLVGFYLADAALNVAGRWYSFYRVSDPASLPYLALVMTLVFIAAFPLFNFFSRLMEYNADAEGALLSGKKAALISSLKKLGEMNLALKNESKLVEFLFLSHPTIDRRVARLQG